MKKLDFEKPMHENSEFCKLPTSMQLCQHFPLNAITVDLLYFSTFSTISVIYFIVIYLFLLSLYAFPSQMAMFVTNVSGG